MRFRLTWKGYRFHSEVFPFGNIGTSPWVFLERTHVNKKCETELTGRWWRLQNCCTTLLPKLCCDRSLSLEKTLQLRSLWSLGKAKRTWDEKVVKVSNGAGKVFRQKNHFQKCVFVMRVIWGLHYWVNHASHKTLSNLLQASNQWQVYSSTDYDIVCILIWLNLGIFSIRCDDSGI